MIVRYQLRCPGCAEEFFVRLGIEPTRGTRFYLPCPHCRLPIRGSMAGSELENHHVSIECDVLSEPNLNLPDARVITINPFVPSRYDADFDSPLGAFPNITLGQLLDTESFLKFVAERSHAAEAVQAGWPQTQMLLQYYLQPNTQMFDRIAKDKFGLDWQPQTRHQRTSVAYQALGIVTTAISGRTGNSSEIVIGRFVRKHTAAIKRDPSHLLTLRDRGRNTVQLESRLLTEINQFVDHYESWEVGLLPRFIGQDDRGCLDGLVLYRDEFSIVRDLYQQGFELACRCLWPLVAAQNTVKRGNPNAFGDDHPESIPENRRAKKLSHYDKLANAHKIAYVAQVPGWEPLGRLLDSTTRNTIGHATAHHDLQTGRITSDINPSGISYLDFIGHTFGVFEALSILAQVIRTARVASSEDFGISTTTVGN